MARDQYIENLATPLEHLLSPRFAPRNIEQRLSQRFDPHVRELNEWVELLRDDPRLPSGAGRTIPYFDPRCGGINARVLFLMQDPSEVATFTGFVSPDNNDRSANNSTIACRSAGLDNQDRVHWNIFPWWVNVTKKGEPADRSRPAQTYAAALPLAGTLLVDLLAKLPQLSVIVLLGNQARDGYAGVPAATRKAIERRLVDRPLRCPSCSPQSWNNKDKNDPARRRRSEIVIATLTEAARLVTKAP